MKAPTFNDQNGGDFEPCPPGVYAACLVRLIDKGSRQESYQGGPMTWKRKLLLGFEICDDETRMGDATTLPSPVPRSLSKAPGGPFTGMRRSELDGSRRSFVA